MEMEKNPKSSNFSQDVNRLNKLLSLKQSGAIHLGTNEAGQPLYLKPEWLKTHLMIMGPTGCGKSCLCRIIFRELLKLRASIVLDDPKADLIGDLEQDLAVLGLEERTTVFDTSRQNKILAFNPLRRNGLPVKVQGLWTLGGIRSAWGQESFNETPQMFRWLYNSIIPTIELEGSFMDTLNLLHYEENITRKNFVDKISDPLIRQEWLAYEALNPSRRREETASSFARLLPFAQDPTIQKITLPQSCSLDLGEILRQGKILLTTFPRYRPLEPDLVNLLRSLFLQSVLAQAFYYPLGKRPPLYIILDEAEHTLAHDTGVIETILNEGRSLGIHLILIFHSFSQVAESENPHLVNLVLEQCRTKILGGGLTHEDLEILTKELFIQEWNPWIVKQELKSLELDPIESKRLQTSVGQGTNKALTESLTCSLGVALGQAVTESISHTLGEAVGESFTRQEATTEGNSRTESLQKSQGGSLARGGNHSRGISSSESDGESEGDGSGSGLVQGMVIGPDGQITQTGSSVQSNNQNKGHFSGQSFGESESWGESWSEGKSWNEALGLARSLTKAITRGIAVGLSRTLSESWSQGYSHQQSITESESLSKGVSCSAGVSENQTVTEVPFYEYKKRWRVSSREFLSLDEFLTTKLIKLKTQQLARFAIKTPEGKAVFFKAAWVKPLMWQIKERLNKFREKIFSKPYYVFPEEIDRQLEERSKKFEEEAKTIQINKNKKSTSKSESKEPTKFREKIKKPPNP